MCQTTTAIAWSQLGVSLYYAMKLTPHYPEQAYLFLSSYIFIWYNFFLKITRGKLPILDLMQVNNNNLLYI